MAEPVKTSLDEKATGVWACALLAVGSPVPAQSVIATKSHRMSTDLLLDRDKRHELVTRDGNGIGRPPTSSVQDTRAPRRASWGKGRVRSEECRRERSGTDRSPRGASAGPFFAYMGERLIVETVVSTA